MIRAPALMLGLALAIGASLPAPAQDAGFNPETVATWMAGRPDGSTMALSAAAQARALRLDRTSQALRLNLANDPVGLLQQLDEDERAIVISTFSPGLASGWRYFFAGSLVVVGGIEAETVRVGFYNPLVDGFVLADLRDTGGSFRLVAMKAVSGAAMRGEKVEVGDISVPAWTRLRDVPVPIAIVEVATAGVAAFERAYPLTADSLEPLAGASDTSIARRSGASVALLSTVVSDELWSPVLAAVDPRLQPGAGISAHPALAELPAPARSDLRFAGLLRGETDTTIAAFLSPAAPRLLLFVDVAGGSGNTSPTLGQAALVDVLATRGEER